VNGRAAPYLSKNDPNASEALQFAKAFHLDGRTRYTVELKPWLGHYDEGVPPTLQPYPRITLLELVSEAARRRPGHPALFFKGACLSYSRLERLSDAFASALEAQGVKKGGRVALLLPNLPQFIITQFGAWKAGAVVVPLNPMYTRRELERALAECGAETAVVLTSYYRKIKIVQPATALHRIIATNIKEYLPLPARFLFTMFRERGEGHRVSIEPGDMRLIDLLRRYAGVPRPDVQARPEDPAVLIYTGGTTGEPKAALGTHHDLLISGMQFKAWLGKVLTDWEDSIVCNMPLCHIAGFAAVLTTAMAGHHPLAMVPDPRDIDDTLATIRRVRAVLLPGVPRLFNKLLERPDVRDGKADLGSIKLCIAGAEPLLAETKQNFERVTGLRLIEGYALTESMMAGVFGPVHGAYRPGAVGLPLPDVEVRIVDSDTGRRILPAGKVGKILLRAPQLMAGYWRHPEETARALRDGWLYTGDLGFLDGDGYLYVVDREKDVIKHSGFQVWPREVEEVIGSHPAVAEVGVAGVPNDCLGETVKAWVVVRDGEGLTAGELRAYCRERLVAYKVPEYVEFRNSLPRSLLGKVLRRKLVSQSSDSPE